MSIYTEAEKLILIEGFITSYEKSNERQDSVNRGKADKEAAMMKVDEMRMNGDTLPADSGYKSFEEWSASLIKRINTDSNSLNKIEDQKVLVEALKFYIENK